MTRHDPWRRTAAGKFAAASSWRAEHTPCGRETARRWRSCRVHGPRRAKGSEGGSGPQETGTSRRPVSPREGEERTRGPRGTMSCSDTRWGWALGDRHRDILDEELLRLPCGSPNLRLTSSAPRLDSPLPREAVLNDEELERFGEVLLPPRCPMHSRERARRRAGRRVTSHPTRRKQQTREGRANR